MAATIPDHLPAHASKGQKTVFSLLQRLPAHCIVYYELLFSPDNPDFIVIIPEIGVLTIEIRDWRLSEIQDANKQSVHIRGSEGEAHQQHPTALAREYMFSLMEHCRRHPALKVLLKKDGFQSGRFVMPFGHLCVLPHITGTELTEKGRITSWRDVFPEDEVATSDTLASWEELDAEALLTQIKRFFHGAPAIEIARAQVRALRAAIHPELVIGDLADLPEPAEDGSGPRLKVLDIRQEFHARNIGPGHRVFYGVVGSGKTLVIITRARLLARANPKARIMVLCYNVFLANYLRDALSDVPQVTVAHFHAWALQNGIAHEANSKDRFLGKRFLFTLEKLGPQARKFDAILIDEAQDFSPEWFRCAVMSLAHPEESDLFILGDGSQSHYGGSKHNWTWADVTVKGQGRRTPSRLDLDHDYRNAGEILEIAASFSTPSSMVADDINGACVKIDLERPLHASGNAPQLLRCQHKVHECRKVSQIVRELLAGRWLDEEIDPLLPEQIGILYPYVLDKDIDLIESIVRDLSDVGITWIRRFKGKPEGSYSDPGVKIQAITSSKGMQYTAVILIFADEFPRKLPDCTPLSESKLMYVALTRAVDFLAVTCSADSQFVDRMIPKVALSLGKGQRLLETDELYEWISPADQR